MVLTSSGVVNEKNDRLEAYRGIGILPVMVLASSGVVNEKHDRLEAYPTGELLEIMMKPDAVVAEVRIIRERFAAKYNYDMRASGRDARVRSNQGKSPRH